MQLYSRIIGDGRPLLILHGLFGMSDNWLTIARELASSGYRVHIPDLRNHGRSPHTKTHRYPDMCDDILEYAEQNNLKSFDIIGHSMGGKLGMIFTLLHPEMVNKLVVADIAPSDYRHPDNTFHADLINTLLTIDLKTYSGRGGVRAELEKRTGDHDLAMFLAKNVTRDPDGKVFRWRLNLPVLQKYLQHLYIGLDELELYAPSPVSTLFLKGNNSNYYTDRHEPDRQLFFPESRVVGIDGAGHWLHSEQPDAFLREVIAFLR